jgi:peptidoglycan/LPS O-acetylase OafA/YrhL
MVTHTTEPRLPEEATTVELSGAYRPDIDGIRAFAVTAVVLFHAGITRMHGGFIGVDVFFVISGYLISGIILRGLRNDRFSLAGFYVRRINRILPALLLVMLVTVLLGWLVMFAEEFTVLGKHTFAGSTFSSNFFFRREQGYFDSRDRPLLHLWSLAVEEQFYLFWPLLLLLVWKRRQNVRLTIVAIIVLSFCANIWLVYHRRSIAAFYLPVSRFWEILAGSLLIHLELGEDQASRSWRDTSYKYREPLALCGALLIGVSLYRSQPGDAWPSWQGILPVVGTILLISAGAGSWINTRIFGNRAVVALGLVSYPLYLWHWPLIVFSAMVYEGISPDWLKIAAVLSSLALAILTYRFIERPIRFGARKQRSAILLLPGLAVTAAAGGIAYFGAIGPRIEDSQAHLERRWGPGWVEASENEVYDADGNTIFSTSGADSNVVVIFGDSHAQQYWPRVQRLAGTIGASGRKAVLMAYPACPQFPESNRRGTGPNGRPFTCDEFNRRAFAYMHRPEVKTIMISGYWELYMGARPVYQTGLPTSDSLSTGSPEAEKAFARLESEVGSLVASGKTVFLVLSNPAAASRLPNSNIPRRFAGFAGGPRPPVAIRAQFVDSTSWVTSQLKLISRRTGAKTVDPADYLCNQVECPSHTPAGEPIYFDANHLRAGFVASHPMFVDSVLFH